MPALIAKLASLDRRGWQDLFSAQAALIRAQIRLRREPVGSLVVRDPNEPTRSSGSAQRAHALAAAVQRAATRGLFRPLCLVRALALQELLESHAIRGSHIRVGVRSRRGQFGAHAWVRWGNEVLGDTPEFVATFTEVDDIGVLQRS